MVTKYFPGTDPEERLRTFRPRESAIACIGEAKSIAALSYTEIYDAGVEHQYLMDVEMPSAYNKVAVNDDRLVQMAQTPVHERIQGDLSESVIDWC